MGLGNFLGKAAMGLGGAVKDTAKTVTAKALTDNLGILGGHIAKRAGLTETGPKKPNAAAAANATKVSAAASNTKTTKSGGTSAAPVVAGGTTSTRTGTVGHAASTQAAVTAMGNRVSTAINNVNQQLRKLNHRTGKGAGGSNFMSMGAGAGGSKGGDDDGWNWPRFPRRPRLPKGAKGKKGANEEDPEKGPKESENTGEKGGSKEVSKDGPKVEAKGGALGEIGEVAEGGGFLGKLGKAGKSVLSGAGEIGGKVFGPLAILSYGLDAWTGAGRAQEEYGKNNVWTRGAAATNELYTGVINAPSSLGNMALGALGSNYRLPTLDAKTFSDADNYLSRKADDLHKWMFGGKDENRPLNVVKNQFKKNKSGDGNIKAKKLIFEAKKITFTADSFEGQGGFKGFGGGSGRGGGAYAGNNPSIRYGRNGSGAGGPGRGGYRNSHSRPENPEVAKNNSVIGELDRRIAAAQAKGDKTEVKRLTGQRYAAVEHGRSLPNDVSFGGDYSTGGGYNPKGGGGNFSLGNPGKSGTTSFTKEAVGVVGKFRPREVGRGDPSKSLLDFISKSEGTRSYNTSLANGAFLPGGKEQNLTRMTLNQIMALQGEMLRNPKNKYDSSALGRYQIVRKTLRSMMGRLHLSGDEQFDEKMQDRLAGEIIKTQGLGAWEGLKIGGRMGEAQRLLQNGQIDAIREEDKNIHSVKTKSSSVGSLDTTGMGKDFSMMSPSPMGGDTYKHPFEPPAGTPGEPTGTVPGKTDKVNPVLLSIIDRASQKLGVKLSVTSGFRTEKENLKTRGASHSQHLLGHASDLTAEGHPKSDKRFWSQVNDAMQESAKEFHQNLRWGGTFGGAYKDDNNHFDIKGGPSDEALAHLKELNDKKAQSVNDKGDHGPLTVNMDLEHARASRAAMLKNKNPSDADRIQFEKDQKILDANKVKPVEKTSQNGDMVFAESTNSLTGNPALDKIREQGKRFVAEALSEKGLNDKAIANSMGNVDAESGFIPKSEDGRYGVKGLYKAYHGVGPHKLFKSMADLRNVVAGGPRTIFERLYGMRKGLGNINPGDGYKYHGRGEIQLTGRANYEHYGNQLRIDLVNNPDLANDPLIAPKLAAAYMKDHDTAKFDHLQTISGATRAVGPHDIQHQIPFRDHLAQKYRGMTEKLAKEGASMMSAYDYQKEPPAPPQRPQGIGVHALMSAYDKPKVIAPPADEPSPRRPADSEDRMNDRQHAGSITKKNDMPSGPDPSKKNKFQDHQNTRSGENKRKNVDQNKRVSFVVHQNVSNHEFA